MNLPPLMLAISLVVPLQLQATETMFQRDHNGYEGVSDATLRGAPETVQTTNGWGGELLEASGVPWGGNRRMVLLRFDHLFGEEPGRIPPTATIHSARLELHKLGEPLDQGQYASLQEQNRVISVFRMLKGYQAGSPDMENDRYACFSYRSYGGDQDEHWGEENRLEEGPVSGVDYEEVAAFRIPLETGRVGYWCEMDVTSDVQSWQAGAPNHGYYLHAHGFYVGASFASSQHPEVELRPRLIVEWD